MWHCLIVCLVQSCREAIDKQTDAYSTQVYGVYSAILAFEVDLHDVIRLRFVFGEE